MSTAGGLHALVRRSHEERILDVLRLCGALSRADIARRAGLSRYAGEFGHITVPDGGGLLCRCGKRGCVETLASVPAILARCRSLGVPLESLDDLRAAVTIAEPTVDRVLRETGVVLGSAARLHQPVEATFEYYLATRAIETLERYAADLRAGDKPFFLQLNFFGPHLPYIIPDAYFDMFDPELVELPKSIVETFENKPPVQRNYSAHWTFDTMPLEVTRKLIAVYWGYVALIDEQIGRVTAALQRLGLTDETSVFFTCDHGEFTGSHRLHDKGPAMYEDIYRTPGLLRVPGQPQGVVRTEFVSLLDCTATILELAGIDPAPAVDSRSLVPLLSGEPVAWAEDIVCEFHGHHFPYPQRMLRTDRYKLVVNPDSTNELYDLGTDPDELDNRYGDAELAEIRTAMMGRLYRLLRDRGDNFYHWMTSMYEVGDVEYDPTMSGLDESTYREEKV